jgi:hypothetical protein
MKVHSSIRRRRRRRRRKTTEHPANLQHISCTKMHLNQMGLQKLFSYHAVWVQPYNVNQSIIRAAP